jgi:AcrR family transcriptional regulator
VFANSRCNVDGRILKKPNKQGPARRRPQQQRSLYKVELILEAAIRLLDEGGMASLNTNAVAATAGISVGTLYQYFPDKEAILDALAVREVADFSASIIALLEEPPELAAEGRVERTVRAAMGSYGGRTKVHRLVMEHSLGQESSKLRPLIERVIALMTSGILAGSGERSRALSSAEAFVLTHAFVGVVRAMIRSHGSDAPTSEAIEQALVKMVRSFRN